MTTQGETTAADEPLDPSQMYSGISMANDRINALQTESPKIKLVKYKTYFFIFSSKSQIIIFTENGEKKIHKELKMLIRKKKPMEQAGKNRQKFKKMSSTSEFTILSS